MESSIFLPVKALEAAIVGCVEVYGRDMVHKVARIVLGGSMSGTLQLSWRLSNRPLIRTSRYDLCPGWRTIYRVRRFL